MTRNRVVVVGAGIAGLATAALLARDGHDVEVIERRDDVGGRCGVWESDGFVFDTGPSWYLMPEVFDHFFELMGTTTARELDLVRLDPAYRVITQDDAATGRAPLDVRSDLEDSVTLFETVEPGAGERLRAYLKLAREAYELAVERFLYTSFQSLRPLFHRDVLRRTGTLVSLLLRPLDKHVARSFHDPRLRQVLGYPAVFLGTSPDRAPSMYHLMSHLDLADGVRYPQGGFGTVIDAVRKVALEAGVSIVTGTEVTAVLTREGRSPGTSSRTSRTGRAHVTGVEVRDADGTHLVPADVVVGAGDLHHLETRLLPEKLQTYPERWWAGRDPGPGAVLVHLGVRGELPQLIHHTLLFTSDWDANFDAVYGKSPRVPDPASLYVCTPSRTDPSVAPDGHENIFILVPVPADPTDGPSLGRGGIDGAGDAAVERVADAAIAQVAAWTGVSDLAERIVLRRTVGPGDFATDLLSWRGGALGPAHTLRQSAMLRGRNASRHVDGLLYAGGSTIPGIGLPMCLISAEIALKRLRGDTSTGPLPANTLRHRPPVTPGRPA